MEDGTLDPRGHGRSALPAAWLPISDVDSPETKDHVFLHAPHAARLRILWRGATTDPSGGFKLVPSTTTVAVAGTDDFEFRSDLYREPGARENVNRPSALGFRAYVSTFPMLEPMSTGLDALVVSLRVQAVTQSAVTFVLQAGKIGFLSAPVQKSP
jgi:hypothetical protein